MAKDGFIFHESTIAQASILTDEELGHLLRFFIKYHSTKIEPVIEDRLLQSVFMEWKRRYDNDTQKYEERCTRNRTNGSKSNGAPIGNTNASKEVEQEEKQPTGLKKQPKTSEKQPKTTQNNPNEQKNNPLAPDVMRREEKRCDVMRRDITPTEVGLFGASPCLKPIPKGYEKFDFSFVGDELYDVFCSWLDYKRERNEKYKTIKSAELCYKKLLDLSGGNKEKAKLIIEQSMANNWSGLFELREKKQTYQQPVGFALGQVHTNTNEDFEKMPSIEEQKRALGY